MKSTNIPSNIQRCMTCRKLPVFVQSEEEIILGCANPHCYSEITVTGPTLAIAVKKWNRKRSENNAGN